jgi:hypothetical protein
MTLELLRITVLWTFLYGYLFSLRSILVPAFTLIS